MPSYQIIQTLLCKKLKVSKSEALNFIYNQQVYVNNAIAKVNQYVYVNDEVLLNNKIIQEGLKYRYFKLYKPRGIECTLNKNIANNLHAAFKIEKGFSYIGRLDKESEGLIILTNDGFINQVITKKNNKIEKEYIVKVDKEINLDFISNMSSGVSILGKTTLPCPIEKTSAFQFRIILTQGINRQIRRMCYKLGYQVTELKRIRIGKVKLDNLKPGEIEELEEIVL